MSVYMTEDEQIEAIKKWWRQYQNHILLLVSIVLLSFTAVRYWQWHQEKISLQASMNYEQMMQAYVNHDQSKIRAYAHALDTAYKNTVYASVARLIQARLYVQSNDLTAARSQLERVMTSSSMPALQQVARVRLARIQLAQKDYDKAHQTLSIVNDNAWTATIAELNGDIYQAQGDKDKAIQAYQTALQESKNLGFSNSALEMKAVALGIAINKLNQSHLAAQNATINV